MEIVHSQSCDSNPGQS